MNVLERFFEMINSHTFVRLLNTKFKKCNTEFSTIESSFFTIAVEDLVVVDIPDDPQDQYNWHDHSGHNNVAGQDTFDVDHGAGLEQTFS